MDKAELHNQLANLTDPVVIASQDFIDIYGKDDKRKVKGVQMSRADILAGTYGLSVVQDGNNYTFTRA